MRRTLIAVVTTAFCAALLPAGAWGQDRQSETPAAAQQSEPRGKIVRDAPEALRVQDMTMDELQQRLAEYEAGKRDDRDGYIILNQLWFNYEAQGRTSSPDFQAIVSKRDGLLKKRPGFGNLQDFRLSDKIKRDKEDEEQQRAAKTQAKRWAPSDRKLLRVIGSGNRAVAIYQYRLEFYKLPAGTQLGVSAKTNRQSIQRNGKDLVAGELQPSKVVTFKTKFDLKPNWPDDIKENFLVCSDLVSRYNPASPDERKTMALLGHTHGMLWTNAAGNKGQFCGILSLNGDVVYEFPFAQVSPNKLLRALKMSPDESWAAVMIGEIVSGEDHPGIGKPREVWIWRKPNRLDKYPANSSDPLVSELLAFFPKR